MNATSPCIALLDSGVGGLSIFQEVRKRLPGASYLYCADNQYFPYGIKTDAEVLACVESAVTALVRDHSPDLVVVACNTASTLVLNELRALYPFPIVGVVPAVKPAAALSRSKIIGLLATSATIQRPYIDQLIKEHAQGCRVVRVGSATLVELAERELRGEVLDERVIAAEIAPLFGPDAQDGDGSRRLDHVVLGCTHYPLLKAYFERSSVWPVTWLDSGAAIADRVATLLATKTSPLAAAGRPPLALFTREDAHVAALQPRLAQFGFANVDFLRR